MRKGLVLVLLSILAFTAYGQITIEKSVDEMTDEVSYYPSERLIVANEAKTQGFTMEAYLDVKKGKLYVKAFTVSLVDLGSCNENNEMIILFQDGTKMVLQSFGDFKCKTYTFFMFTDEQEAMAKAKKIKKIRFKNGFTFDEFTGVSSNESFFIELYNAIETKNR
jgi:hypothetical protein